MYRCDGCRYCETFDLHEKKQRDRECRRSKPKCCQKEEDPCANPNRQLWLESDYNYNTGVSPFANFAVKSTSYNSPMALQGTAYRTEPWLPDYQPRYYYHKASTTYPPGVPVPSGFDFGRGPSYWFDDTKYEMGQQYYSTIIGGFGHTHILAVQASIRVKMANPDADVSDWHKQMESMKYGSTDIFRKFAQLVDSCSNPIAYDVNTPAGKLKQMMAMLISGPDPIDINALAKQFKDFLSFYFPAGNAELNGYIEQMVAYANKCLYNGEIDFTSWFVTMSIHQDYTHMGYDMYTEYYNSKNKEEAAKKLNKHCRGFLNTGERMAAFFGVFMFAVVILDRAMTLLGSPTPPAIPTEKVNDILNYVLSNQLAAWRQHIWGFLDYDMVAANKNYPCQMKELFEIQTTMLETCNPLACFVGKIMSSFDRLVQGRNLYVSLNSI